MHATHGVEAAVTTLASTQQSSHDVSHFHTHKHADHSGASHPDGHASGHKLCCDVMQCCTGVIALAQAAPTAPHDLEGILKPSSGVDLDSAPDRPEWRPPRHV